jgi:CheY-like chemotaxis protein
VAVLWLSGTGKWINTSARRFVPKSLPWFGVASNPERVAIVDTSEHIRRRLDARGRRVGAPAGGEELRPPLGPTPDCVVLSLHMPMTDRFSVLEQLSQKGFDVPVAVIAGFHTAESRKRVIAAGTDAYLRKPIDDHRLISTIQEVSP